VERLEVRLADFVAAQTHEMPTQPGRYVIDVWDVIIV